MEGFGQIIDPETNKLISTNTQHGKHIIKNYLNAIKHGADSDKIISTRMFYKKKGGSKSTQKRTSRSSNNSSRSNRSNRSSGSNKQKLPQKQEQQAGSFRGVCPVCKKNVTSNDRRVKSGGKYYMEDCWNTLQAKK